HPTLRAITSHYADCLYRRGLPGDVDRMVALRRAELGRSDPDNLGADWIGVSRADLAVALLARARYRRLDPDRAPGAGDGDVAAARELIEVEANRRSATYGPAHPFTWRARALRVGLLVALAEQ